ncbi:MAG: hypothetical protein SFU98_17015 [Leptospiraceae bacterium]|nr:hypothetical protein [Leptospiraceae bacterium]
MKLKNFFLIFSLVVIQIFSQTPKGKWSKNFGKMSWFDAKKKCESIGMRLPTLNELKGAFLDNEMLPWAQNMDESGLLWASDTLNEETAASFATDGYEYPHTSRVSQEEITSVRCIQKKFKRIRKSSGIQWSSYQGSMGLEDAKKKCASLKMKLPSIDQFKKGTATGEFEGWETGLEHWSRDKATNIIPEDNATNLTYSITWRTYSTVPTPSLEPNHVRCVK